MMKFLIKTQKKFIELYLSMLTLPTVYKPKSKVMFCFILIITIFTVIFNFGLYVYLHSNLVYLFVYYIILLLLLSGPPRYPRGPLGGSC